MPNTISYPRCAKGEPPSSCAIIGATGDHFVTNTHEIEDIFKTLQGANTTYVCGQFIIFSACFYSYRNCDSQGSQKLICEDVCPLIAKLYADCVRKNVVRQLMQSTNNEEVRKFMRFAMNFNCSMSETYEIVGVNISNSCQDLSFIKALLPGIYM